MPSQALINQFVNAPHQFMRAYLVAWRGAAPEDQQNIQVVMRNWGTGRRRTGAVFLGMGNAKETVDRFELRWADDPYNGAQPGEHQFSAVWSGYKGRQARIAQLGQAGGPSLMLTPELTGCAVVRAFADDGSARFGHYNLVKPGTDTVQDDDDMRQAIDQDFAGAAHATMTKGDYRARGKRSDAVRVTVVGHRVGTQWRFWAQYREDKPSGQQLRHVELL